MAAVPEALGVSGSREAGAAASGSALALMVVGMSFFWQFLRDANSMTLFVPCAPFGASLSPRMLMLAFYALALVSACALSASSRVRSALVRPAPLAVLGAFATALGAGVHAADAFGWPAGTAVAAVQLAEVCLLALLFAALTAFWAGVCSEMMEGADQRATWGVLGSSLASLVFSFALFTLMPVKSLFPLAIPLAAALFAALYGFRFPGRAGGDGRGGGNAAGCERESRRRSAARSAQTASGSRALRLWRPAPAQALFAVLVGVLAISTCAKGMYDVLVAGSIDTSMQLKHFITIAELAAIMLVCLCAAGVERLAFLGWAVLTGGLVTGLALMSFTGSATIMQVGLGTVAAARTCCEAFVFILVASRGAGGRAPRLALRAFAVPELVACLVGYGLLPAALTAAGSEGVGALVGFVSVGLGVAVVACAFLLMASFALRGLDGRDEVGAGDGLAGGVAGVSDGAAGAPGAAGAQRVDAAAGVDTGADVPGRVLADRVPGDRGEVAGRIEALGERCGLTPREREVAAYVFRGYSAKRIAEIDCVSLNTVQTHTRNVYRKLGVHSRQDLIDLVEGSAEG